MLAWLEEQSSLFGRLESLASKQRTLVSQEDTGPLLALLGERQRLSSRLTQLGSRLEPIRRNWNDVRGRLSGDQRSAADRCLAESRKRLQRIMDSDEHDARVLAARKQNVAQALRGTHDSRCAVTAYRVPPDRALASGCLDEAS
jgi:hypothetical protein